MPTLVQDLVIQQGATFQLVVQLVDGPDNISGFDARMTIRPSRAAEEVYAEWTTPVELTVDNAAKQIIIDVDHTETEAMVWSQGVYDLELEGDGKVWRVMSGLACLSKEVTR